MSFRRTASRQQFDAYRRNLGRRRKSGEFRSSHGGRAAAAKSRSHRSFITLLVEFFKLLRGHRRAIGFALATLTVSTLLTLIPPAATKVAVDYVLLGNALPDNLPAWLSLPDDKALLLAVLAVAVVAVSATETVIHVWGRWHATRATRRVQAQVRRQVFEHAVRLPLHRVYELKSGGVASILREDAGGVAELIFSMLYNPWRAVVQLLGSLVVLVWVDWRLLLGSLVLVPTIFFTHRTWISRIRPLYRDIRLQRQEIDSHATEAFGGMRVVRAFGRQRSETGRFLRATHVMARQELHVWWWARSVELIWQLLLPLASAALLWYGGSRVVNGALSLGDLTMFLAYLAMLLGPLAVLASTATQFQSNLAGLDRVLDLLEEPQEMLPRPGAIKVAARDVAGRITLRNLSFRYPRSRDLVLRDIEFEAQPGELVALVGASGAGKTTLCNLIARFYDPTSGAIELDRRDLREIEVESYRRLLGIVEQDVFLFDGTVAENIGYAVRSASPHAIRHAAEVASAHEFILELDDGYDTIIGERGVRLSGGQRQRLAIARAVLADPRILILDEATSSLDTHSERLIQAALENLMRGRTSFVIAHRLSTVAHADRIIVLEKGEIVEDGTHAGLMAASGRYRQMVHLQLGLAEVDAGRAT